MTFFQKKKLQIFSIVISSIFLANTTLAASEAVIHLEKNSPAPYSGILFPIETANDLRKDLIELSTLRILNESYSKSVQLYQKHIQSSDDKFKLITDQNDKLAESLVESRRSNDFQKVLWFGLGVLATGFAVYGAKKITQ